MRGQTVAGQIVLLKMIEEIFDGCETSVNVSPCFDDTLRVGGDFRRGEVLHRFLKANRSAKSMEFLMSVRVNC
jgi:hypothetical protein